MRVPRPAGRRLAGLAVVLLALSGARAASGVRVTVELPVPPKINTRSMKKILVARFVSSEHAAISPGREFVRLVKRELAKTGRFEVLDVDPPALPEQPVEELPGNATFWKHIAEEYGADLVISGRILFTTADRSGFVQEDAISPVTGQKVRRTRFAEREEYMLEANLWFFKGANGSFLYEDTFRNTQIFEGRSNDPLQIFFNLADRVTPDLLGIVMPQKRQEQRYVFDE